MQPGFIDLIPVHVASRECLGAAAGDGVFADQRIAVVQELRGRESEFTFYFDELAIRVGCGRRVYTA